MITIFQLLWFSYLIKQKENYYLIDDKFLYLLKIAKEAIPQNNCDSIELRISAAFRISWSYRIPMPTGEVFPEI